MKRRLWARYRVATFIAVAALFLLSAGDAWMRHSRQASPFPSIVRSQHVAFPLYYPDLRGSDFTIRSSDIVFNRLPVVLLMPISNSVGHHITISEQAKPSNLTTDQLLGQGAVITNVNGQAGVSNVEGRNVAFFVSPDNKTLILLNSSDASTDELTALVELLRPVR